MVPEIVTSSCEVSFCSTKDHVLPYFKDVFLTVSADMSYNFCLLQRQICPLCVAYGAGPNDIQEGLLLGKAHWWHFHPQSTKYNWPHLPQRSVFQGVSSWFWRIRRFECGYFYMTKMHLVVKYTYPCVGFANWYSLIHLTSPFDCNRCWLPNTKLIYTNIGLIS